MRRGARFVVLTLGCLGAVSACTRILGIRDLDESESVDAGACSVVGEGDSRVRFAHLAPGVGPVDVCLNGGTTPLVRSFPGACPAGYAFREVSSPIPAPAGSLEVKIVEGGSEDCSGRAIATGRALAGAGGTVTLMLLGRRESGPTLTVLDESPTPPLAVVAHRFVHAAPDVGPLDYGVVSDANPPVFVGEPLFRQVAFGETGTAGTGPPTLASPSIDENGYAEVSVLGPLRMGVGAANEPLLVSETVDFANPGGFTLTLYATAAGSRSLAALVCRDSEANGIYTVCDSPDILDVATVNLRWGGRDAYERERRDAQLGAMRDSNVDALCVQAAWLEAGRESVRDATTESFPNAVWFETDLDTPIDEPTDLDGLIPEPFSTPPCADPQVRAAFETVIDCIASSCSTIPGSREGELTTAECALSSCLPGALAVGALDPRCGECIQNVAPTTIAQAHDQCVNHPNGLVRAQGQNSMMILSKLPVLESERLVIPGSASQRVILAATLDVVGEAIDVYCAHFTFPFPLFGFGYVGLYGSGETGTAGFENEQKLQAKKLEEYVFRRSGGRRALVMGEFNAGREHRVGNEIVLGALGTEALDILEGAFTPIHPREGPFCTTCVDNVLVDPAVSFATSHVFLHGFDPSAGLDVRRIWDRARAIVEADAGTTEVPAFATYGAAATIRISP